MMWVRLIGGIADGQSRKVDEDQQILQAVERVPVAVTPRLSLAATSSETRVATYTRRRVHCDGGEIIYFAPEGWSDFAALQSVLGP